MQNHNAKPTRAIAIAIGLAAAAAAMIGASLQSASADTVAPNSYIGYDALNPNGATAPSGGGSTDPYQRACTEQSRCARG